MNITLKPWVLVVIALVAGCAGAAVSKFVVPPARAESVPKWEYLCGHPRQAELMGQLYNAGREGWELVSVARAGDAAIWFTWCAKRPLP
jgi:hypothetical protein